MSKFTLVSMCIVIQTSSTLRASEAVLHVDAASISMTRHMVKDKACAPHSAGIARVYGPNKIQAGERWNLACSKAFGSVPCCSVLSLVPKCYDIAPVVDNTSPLLAARPPHPPPPLVPCPIPRPSPSLRLTVPFALGYHSS